MQLDINQPFALFYPERRPFFTEGTDFFSALESIIYTRTIRDPTWGIKLTGEEGANTIGAFMLRDEVTNLIFPGSQGSSSTSLDKKNMSSVFRYKLDLGSRYTVGLLATDREGKDYFNRVYGFDLDFRFTQLLFSYKITMPAPCSFLDTATIISAARNMGSPNLTEPFS